MTTSSLAFFVGNLRSVAVLLLASCTLLSHASLASSEPPSLRERVLAAADPDHDGSIVKVHNVEHSKFHGSRVLETIGVGVHVFVAYRNDLGRSNVHANLTTVGYEMDSVKTVAGVLPSVAHLLQLAEDPDVDWIAEDSILRAAGETVPYGVGMTTSSITSGMRQYAPNQQVQQGSNSNCRDRTTFKV
jgi:hypothetical protein